MNQIILINKINHLLEQRSIPARQQNAFLAKILGLHYTSVQKKMNSKKGWTEAQIKELSAYFKTPLDGFIEKKGEPRVSVLIKYGNRIQRGKMTVGVPLLNVSSDDLVAVQTSDGWLINLSENAPSGERYTFENLEVLPKPHIAVIDDEIEVRQSLKETFERIGFKCDSFATTNELLSCMKNVMYEGFIFDWMLANENTPEKIISDIRTNYVNHNAPIIVLTGKLETQDVEESELAKIVQAYRVMIIEKPIRPKILGTTLFNMIMTYSKF